MSFSSFTSAKNGKELYYWRLDAWLKTVGEYNQIRGVYDKLDCYMPPEVQFVFNKYYGGNSRIVVEKYNELSARIERQWGAVMESIKELGLECTEQAVKDFRSMARSTMPESKFRTAIRNKVKRLYEAAVKAREKATEGKTVKEQPTMTLRDLIVWYQTPKPKRSTPKSTSW